MLANINSIMLLFITLLKMMEASTNCMYNQYFTIFQGSSAVTPYKVGGYQFTVTWDIPQPNITASSYILIGFTSQNNSKLLSFQASISSPTATGAVFNFNPTTNSQIVSAHFSIALLKNCNAQISLQYIEYIPTVINKPRWQRQGLSQQILMINQTFNFTTTQYKSAIMLSSMTMLHVEDMIRLNLVLNPIVVATNYQQLSLRSNLARNNSFTKICLTYFTIGQESAKSQLYIYSVTSQNPITSFSAPLVFFPNVTHKCLVGIYDFRNTPIDNNPFSIIITPPTSTTGPNIYDVAILRVDVYNYYVACLANCEYNYAPSYATNTETCLSCLGIISNCIGCNTTTTCLVCAAGYYLNSTSNDTCQPCLSACKMCLNTTYCLNCTNSSSYIVSNLCTEVKGCITAAVSNQSIICTQCNIGLHLFLNTKDNLCECILGFYVSVSPYRIECVRCLDDCYSCKDDKTCIYCLKGNPVDGGCTADSGCLKVNSSKPYEANRCTACDKTNFYTLVEGTCVCMQGYFQISNTCTNIVGCVVARKVGSVFLCANCNTRLNFQNIPINNKCICKEGYQVSNGECIDKCGDGKRYTNQCDDGNLISNDGCSSKCLIEVNFACYGSSADKSKCIYLKYDIKIQLVSINKVFMSNRGIFKFRITPFLSSYELLDLDKSVNFTTQRNHSIMSKSLSSGYLTLQIDYTEDLQGQAATIIFQLNRPYFLQNIAKLEFKMISDDSKLIISQNQQQLGSISAIINLISLISLFIFLGSIYFHKMIGVQTIQNLQVIFLVHMINEDYTTPFGLISSLSNSALNFLFSTDQTANIYSIKNNFKFDANNQYLSELSITLFTFLSLAILVALLLVKKIKHERHEEDKSPFSEGLIKINQYIDRAYSNGVYPVIMGFFLVSFLIKVTQSESSETSLSLTLGIVCQTILSSQIFFFQTKYLIVQWKAGPQGIKQAKKYFISYYLIFQFLISAIIILGYLDLPIIMEYYLTILYVIFFVFFLIYRPYKQIIHNIGLLVNIFTTLVFILWCSLRKMNLSDKVMQEGKEILAVYILIAMISLCLVVAVIRIVMEIRSSSLCKPKQKQIIKKKTNKIFYPQSDQFSEIQGNDQRQEDLLKHHRAYLFEFNLSHKMLCKNIIPVTLFEQSNRKRKKSNNEELIKTSIGQ